MNPPDFQSAMWRKSTRSGSNGGQCVEIAVLGTAVGMRDSKEGGRGPVLVCTLREWGLFVAGAVSSEFK